MDQPFDTLVISGGSSNGIVMLGRINSLYLQKKLDLAKIKTFSGTSIGAAIAFLLSINFTPYEIVTFLADSPVWDQLFWFSDLKSPNAMTKILNLFHTWTVFDINLIKQELAKMIESKLGKIPTFEELNKNFLCCSFNLSTNQMVYFSKHTTPQENVLHAILKSCSIPFLFEKYVQDNQVFIDGGIEDNFPLLQTQKTFECKKILGIMCVKQGDQEEKPNWSLKDVIRILFAPSINCTNLQIEQAQEKCTVVIESVTAQKQFFDLNLNRQVIFQMFAKGS